VRFRQPRLELDRGTVAGLEQCAAEVAMGLGESRLLKAALAAVAHERVAERIAQRV
jgi:hypothetical protein